MKMKRGEMPYGKMDKMHGKDKDDPPKKGGKKK